MKIAKHNANIGHLLLILISSLLMWGFLGIDHQEIHAQAPPPDERIIPLPPVKEADGRLGTCYTFYEESIVQSAYQAGSRWDRFDFRWSAIEGTPGVFLFSGHDTIVNRDLAHSLDVVGILGSTAAWATTDCPTTTQHISTIAARVPGHPLQPLTLSRPLTLSSYADDVWWQPCPPDNLNLPWNHPENAWGNFVYQTVSHFKDRVHVWEIWNEPDLGDVFWSGTPEAYAQLLKVGYEAVKAADPEATVLFGGLAYWSNPSFHTQVLDALQQLEEAASHNFYFDAMSLHLYSNIYNIGPVVAHISANIVSRVGPHPIWLTETGVPLWDENPITPGQPYNYAATAEEAAAYTLESYAEARAVGVEKFFFFRAHDEYMQESFGLIRNDGSLRPAYVTYQMAARYLRGENQIDGPHQRDNGARWITFLGTPYGRTDVLWNTKGISTTHTHTAVLPIATLIDAHGQAQIITATHHAFTLTLEPATANLAPDRRYIIGGPPVLLIQGDTEVPSSTLHPLPVGIYTDVVTLTWRALDLVSGYWYEEIAMGPTPIGPWRTVAGRRQTQGVMQTTINLPPVGSYYQPWYFRARARDRVGNWEAWPAHYETGTDFPLTRTVALSVTAYSFAEDTLTLKLPLRDVRMTWRGPGETLVAHTITSTWRVTETVYVGKHTIKLAHRDYGPQVIPFGVMPGKGIQRITLSPILSKARGIYLPLIFHAYDPPLTAMRTLPIVRWSIRTE
jgi:hypothetical protein